MNGIRNKMKAQGLVVLIFLINIFTSIYHSKIEIEKEEVRLVEFLDYCREKINIEKIDSQSRLRSIPEIVSDPRNQLTPLRELIGNEIPQLHNLDIYDFTIIELLQKKLKISFIKNQIQECLENELGTAKESRKDVLEQIHKMFERL